MSIIKKVKLVGAVLKRAQADVYKFKVKSGLKCVSFCGECCEKKDICATPLEFLPLAYFLYKTKQSEKYLDYLNQNIFSQICGFYKKPDFILKDEKKDEFNLKYENEKSGINAEESTVIKNISLPPAVSGNCSVYRNRGLLCSLFGFTASRGKAGVNIVACRKIKDSFPEEYASAQKKAFMGMRVPFMNDYYTQLAAIDGYLGVKYYPINSAVKIALEYVLSYMDWQGGENCA